MLWFNPSEITKVAKPPVATLETLETSHPLKNSVPDPEVSEVAEVAEVSSHHKSKDETPDGLLMELATESGAIAVKTIDLVQGEPANVPEVNKSLSTLSKQEEVRHQKVIDMLESAPGTRYAMYVGDASTDPVIVTVCIRGGATFELEIPYEKYDGMALLELIEGKCGESHEET
jgi:hypothetical protein